MYYEYGVKFVDGQWCLVERFSPHSPWSITIPCKTKAQANLARDLYAWGFTAKNIPIILAIKEAQ